MEEYEEVYDQETEADPEVTEQEPEGIDKEETGTVTEEPGQEDTGKEEDGADPEEEAGEEQTETEPVEDGSGEGQEEETGEEETGEEGQEEETVSGNDIVIRGDAVIFPEVYDLSMLTSELADTEAIVQAIEAQNENMTAGVACTCFMLGVLAGAMFIAGFRLRRV